MAIGVEPALAAEVERLVRTLRQRAATLAPAARVRWVESSRLHVTLQFIGEVEDAVAARVAAVLAPPIAHPAFEMTLGGLGVFPLRGAPRVLWCGIGDERARLQAVAADVAARLAGEGLVGEDRGFAPHLTLGRIRVPAGLRPAMLFDGLDARIGVQRVDAITLMESRLAPRGSLYHELLRTPLGAA